MAQHKDITTDNTLTLHFSLKQYNHLIYWTLIILYLRLQNRNFTHPEKHIYSKASLAKGYLNGVTYLCRPPSLSFPLQSASRTTMIKCLCLFEPELCRRSSTRLGGSTSVIHTSTNFSSTFLNINWFTCLFMSPNYLLMYSEKNSENL